MLYRRYEALAERTPGVTFTGRLCTHRYYNMDQVVGKASRSSHAWRMTACVAARSTRASLSPRATWG